MEWAGHLGRLLGVLLTIGGLPFALLRPRRTARLLVPPRARDTVVARPLVWCPALAGAVALLAGVGMYAAMFGRVVAAPDDPDPVHTMVGSIVVFGGVMFLALCRSLWAGVVEWRWMLPAGEPGSAGPADRAVLSADPQPLPLAPSGRFDGMAPVERPTAERPSRRLRGAARWLAAAGLGWYFLGRLVQVTQIGSDNGADVPSWWWAVTAVLLGAGAVIWAARRLIRYRDGRTAGTSLDAVELLREWGFQVHRPAGVWVRERAPEAFFAAAAVGERCLWPWAATTTVDGHRVLVAQQVAQVPNRTGLTSARTRTACVIEVEDARLPLVIVSGREAVPPARLGRSLVLELETFNRQLWAWGPDRRRAHGVLHPRVMAPLLRDLPDGAVVTFVDDRIAIHNDEPVRGADVAGHLALGRELAALLPSYMVGP